MLKNGRDESKQSKGKSKNPLKIYTVCAWLFPCIHCVCVDIELSHFPSIHQKSCPVGEDSLLPLCTTWSFQHHLIWLVTLRPMARCNAAKKVFNSCLWCKWKHILGRYDFAKIESALVANNHIMSNWTKPITDLQNVLQFVIIVMSVYVTVPWTSLQWLALLPPSHNAVAGFLANRPGLFVLGSLSSACN